MRFSWRDTLRRMTGADTVCPVCGKDGLVTYDRDDRCVLPDIRGVPFCECTVCGARGDFPELIAEATGKGVDDTTRELRRLGELDASVRDIDTYIGRKAVQADVDAHMSRCVDKLRSAPHMCGIRAGLSVSNLRQLPPDTGMHIVQGAPRQFTLLSGTRYSMVPMTLYRYRFDGETSCVDAQNPKTLQREHRIRITGDVGVYLGDFRIGEVPSVLVGTPNPRTAGQIYGAWRAESSLPSPVVGIAGFPLPRRFEAVSTLYLLDTLDCPLPLEFAVRAISSPTVYGVDAYPTIKVLSPSCAASEITAADIRVLSNSSRHGKHIREWIADKVRGMADRREEVANALLQAGASENTRAEIAELLGQNTPKSLLDTVMLPTAEPDDVFTLGNGKLVKSTEIGIYTAARNRKTGEITAKSLLCNVGIAVDARIVDRGFELACCTITHPDNDVPSVGVRIPRQHWNNCEAIAEDIRAAYAECGRTPYVAFYHVSGYSWGDILQYLGANCPVQTGIRALGATQDGTVNLPNALIGNGRAERQTKAGLVDSRAMSAYSELTVDFTAADASNLTKFLSSAVSLDKTGVAAGILHTLFCTAGKMFDSSGVRRPPAHLVFVETEPGVWDVTMRTLSYLFSGSEYVPLMDYGDRLGFLRGWTQLGTLPLITRLPSAEDMATVLAASPVGVIAVADPLTAVQCSGRGTVSFVLPHVEASCTTQISQDDIVTLRKAFMASTAEKAGTGWLDIGAGGAMSVSTPCLSALGSLTEERAQNTVAGGLYRSVKGRYPGVGMTGARAFFGVLHRTYTAMSHGDNSGIKMTIVTGAPDDVVKASFNERGEHVFILPDKVLVSRSIVQLINKEHAFLFDAEQLSHEFAENGILLQDASDSLGIDSRRVWVFPRSVWDNEVVIATWFKTQKETK